jgi:hypothetical protein
LSRQYFYLDRVKAIEVNPTFVNGPQAGLHEHAAVGERISPLDARKQGEGEEAHCNRDQGKCHQLTQCENPKPDGDAAQLANQSSGRIGC